MRTWDYKDYKIVETNIALSNDQGGEDTAHFFSIEKDGRTIARLPTLDAACAKIEELLAE